MDSHSHVLRSRILRRKLALQDGEKCSWYHAYLEPTDEVAFNGENTNRYGHTKQLFESSVGPQPSFRL